MSMKSILSFVTRLSKRERIIFFLTVSVVSLVLLDRVILTPILDRVGSLGETIQVKEEAIEQSLLIITQEQRIEEEKDRYSSFLSKPQTEEKEITAFLQEIETLAKKSSIYLTDIKPSGKEAEGCEVIAAVSVLRGDPSDGAGLDDRDHQAVAVPSRKFLRVKFHAGLRPVWLRFWNDWP